MKKYLLMPILLFLLAGFSTFDPAAAQSPGDLPWWNQRVFYEIFVRSFYDSDGDGIGDLQGVISQLDYLNDGDPATTDDLGITGIWLMPITEALYYHGYDVVDYRSVERQYGTNEDFKQLIAAAHARGIAVIVDLVLNHTSNLNPWFIASQNGDPKYRDWYIWSDENPGGSKWYEGPRGYYFGNFWAGMPDLNYNNLEVTAEMTDIARFWLEEMGVDGFRIDAAKHLIEAGEETENTPATHAWLKDFNRSLKTTWPESLVVGEVWDSDYAVSPYIAEGSLDLAFEFDMAVGMVQAARRGNKQEMESVQQRALDLYPKGQYAAFLTNHDQDRVMSVLEGNVGAAKAAASLLLTNPGVPFIYYGEEIGMTGQKPDERIRTPMQWDATPETAGFTTGKPWEVLADGYETANVAAMTGNPDSLLCHYRDLIHLRQNRPALWGGDTLPVRSSNRSLYAVLRYTGDEALLVIVNLSGEAVEQAELTLKEGPLSGVSSAAALFGGGEPSMPVLNDNGGFDAYVPLPEFAPYSTTIIELH